MGEVQWNPKRGADVYGSWGSSKLRTMGMVGSDVLDGAMLGGLKGEWLAASAGVVPFVSLPGLGKGVLQIGGALVNPVRAWPAPELESLYLWIQRSMSAMHGSVEVVRRNTIQLPVEPSQSAVFGPAAAFYDGVSSGVPVGLVPVAGQGKFHQVGMHGIGQIETGVLILIGVLGVAATIAAAWYATRVQEKQVEIAGDNARALHATGTLADIASQQLAATGKVDPAVLAAISGIGKPPARPNDWTWAYVLGAGVLGVAGGAAGAELVRRRRGRH